MPHSMKYIMRMLCKNIREFYNYPVNVGGSCTAISEPNDYT